MWRRNLLMDDLYILNTSFSPSINLSKGDGNYLTSVHSLIITDAVSVSAFK